MKRKIIPFDLETANKIQAGDMKGRVKTTQNSTVRIVCWDRKNTNNYPLVGLVRDNGEEFVMLYNGGGRAAVKTCNDQYDLVLEVPDDEPQFKPFDKVLCRDSDGGEWKANLFSHKKHGMNFIYYYVCGNTFYRQCIPYEGNEHLLGTIDKPKEK